MSTDVLRRRSRRAVLLAGLALGLMAIALGGVLLLFSNRFTYLAEHGSVPFLVAAVGFALLASAAAVSQIDPWWRAILPVLLGFCAIGLVGFTVLLDGLAPSVFGERVVARSADGNLRVVHVETSNVIDPVDRLWLRSDKGLLTVQDEIGCFNTEVSSPFADARFLGDDRLEVVAGSQRWTLRFDAVAVEMRDTLPDDVC